MAEQSRNEIVARWHELNRQIAQREVQGATHQELRALREKRLEVKEAYQRWLPRPAITRCPFTGAVVNHQIDPVGLDGMWWSYFNSARELEEDLPQTFFSLQGAMHLEPPVEDTSFLVDPGPGVPYVLPRLLQDPGMRAVVSSLEVGRHIAFAITYFAQPGVNLQRPNAWACNGYTLINEKGEYKWGNHVEDPKTFDYELAPWIAQGKLQWIAPRDSALQLRGTVDGCPYLDLQDVRARQHLENGKVWT